MSQYQHLLMIVVGTSLYGCVIGSPPFSSPESPTRPPSIAAGELQIISLEHLGLPPPAQEIPDGPQLPVHVTDGFGLTKAN